jgi:hypothetical protein
MKFRPPGGIYPCPICGKPRGGKLKHPECSKIMQERRNGEGERKHTDYVNRDYISGRLPPFMK